LLILSNCGAINDDFRRNNEIVRNADRSCWQYTYHSLLRQMSAQKQENTATKMKNTQNYRRKIKRKAIKSKLEYAIG